MITCYRRFYALQVREQKSRTLLEGRPAGNAMCYWLVSSSVLFLRPYWVIHDYRINKMRENCLKEFDAHWQCLEKNNQVLFLMIHRLTDYNSRKISSPTPRNTISVGNPNAPWTSACLRSWCVLLCLLVVFLMEMEMHRHLFWFMSSFSSCIGSTQDNSRYARRKDAHPPRREAHFRGYAEIDAFDIIIHT